MKIGFNILGDSPNLNTPKLLTVIYNLRAPWHLVMNNLELAQAIHQMRPQTKIAYRWTPADDMPLTSWPSAYNFVDFALREFGDLPLYAVVSNEAGDDDALIIRTCEIIEYGCPRGLHVAVLGLPSGTPADIQTWKRPAMRRLLELCNTWRDNVIVLLHEYFCGVVTSGFIGGEPGFIHPDTWPRKLEDVAQWHCGRFNFLLEACDNMAIAAPRILISEHGADDMSDVKFWSQRLTVTPPYLNIRSWKSLWNQWRIWWTRWDSQRAYYEQLKYANEVIYDNPIIEGQLIFAWTSPDAKWEAFDVSESDELHNALINQGGDIPAPPPARKYAPAIVFRYEGSDVYNIRAEATKTSADLGDFKDGDYITFDDVNAVAADDHLWQRGVVYPSIGPARGGTEIAGWLAVDLIKLTEKPIETVPPPVPVVGFSVDDLLLLATAHESIAITHDAVASAHEAVAVGERGLADASRSIAQMYRNMATRSAGAQVVEKKADKPAASQVAA